MRSVSALTLTRALAYEDAGGDGTLDIGGTAPLPQQALDLSRACEVESGRAVLLVAGEHLGSQRNRSASGGCHEMALRAPNTSRTSLPRRLVRRHNSWLNL